MARINKLFEFAAQFDRVGITKDAIMAGAALVTMADSARAYLRKTAVAPRSISMREPSLAHR